MQTFYFSIEENREGQFGAQNCKLYWGHKLVNQVLIITMQLCQSVRPFIGNSK